MNYKGIHILKIIFIVSIFIFVFALGYYFQSKLHTNNLMALNTEITVIQNEISQINNEIKDYERQNEILKNSLNDKQHIFKNRYGFNYNADTSYIYNTEIATYYRENENILRELKLLILNYEPFYDGDYFEAQVYNDMIVDLNTLIAEDTKDNIGTDLYRYLNIDSFGNLAREGGTIGYLKSINNTMDRKTFNILTFYLATNFEYLNELSRDDVRIRGNINYIYKEIMKLVQSYDKCEKTGLNLGNLNMDSLIILKEKTHNLVESYNKNLQIIRALERGEE